MPSKRVQATQSIADEWAEHHYYDMAEDEAWTRLFWDEAGPFRPLFEQLSLGRVVDLACGRGRHSARMVDRCESLVMIDVNESNIAACRSRLESVPGVEFVVNDGFHIPLEDASVDAIFCYDAMVHFDYAAVFSYLEETARVLRPGGRALFHHSNFDKAPGRDWGQNPHARNFMSLAFFQHVAITNGLEVLESRSMPWNTVENLDGLTLVQR